MEILNSEIKEATRRYLAEGLEQPVRLLFFTQKESVLFLPDSSKQEECRFCAATQQLLEEIAALNPLIKLEVHDLKAEKELAATYKVDKVPAILIHGEKEYGLRFFGLPAGYEYGSLLDAIIQVSKSKSKLQDKTREGLKKISQPVHLQVFVTPTCPYCPLAVELAQGMAIESPFITADILEAEEFPDLAQKYQVFGVPKTIINESITVEGAVPEEVLLENVIKAAAPAQT